MTPIAPNDLGQLPVLLGGEPETINPWIERWSARRLAFCAAVILVGAGLFGAAVGCWRAPRQALYTAIKFPLILLLTTLGNALLNGMLAPLLGLDLRFRQSLMAILMSFAIAAAILGAFSLIVFFLVWNMPPMTSLGREGATVYNFILLTQVAVIAFAGVAANLRLGRLLRWRSGSQSVARRVLLAWLAVNLFLGSQFSWIFRPFVGSPYLPLQFLRPDALEGNFYETVLRSLRHLLFD